MSEMLTIVDMESRPKTAETTETQKKLQEKNIKRILMQFIKKEITLIPNDLYDGLGTLVDIDFSASQLKTIQCDLFKYAQSLNSINFSSNQIQTIPNELFKNLPSLISVNFSENRIKKVPNTLFKTNNSLSSINFSGNLLREIPVDFLRGLNLLNSVDFSSNELKSIPKDLFSSNELMTSINFSTNKIKEITNDSLKMLSSLKSIDFSYNELKDLPNDLFNNIEWLKTIDFSNNKITYVPDDLLANSLALQYVDFSSNSIVNLSRYLFLNKSFLLDFRNNIDTNDLSILYGLLFDNHTKFSISSNLYYTYYIFKEYSQSFDFQNFIDRRNKFDNSTFLCRKINSKLLTSNLLSLFLNKTCYHSSSITGNSSYENPVDFHKSYDYMKNKINDFEWSILDYFMFLNDLNNDVIIYFKNLIDSYLTQNPTLINLEFKFKTTEVINAICERNDFILFEAFFQPHAFKKFIEVFSEGKNEQEKFIKIRNFHTKILKYVDEDDFYSNVNYSECFEIALNNQNERIAIHLLLLLKYIILISLSDPKNDLNEPKFKLILDFNNNFLKNYIIKIFEYEWWELVEFILNSSIDRKFIYLLEDDLSSKTTQKKNKISPFDGIKNRNKASENNDNCILMLISKSKKTNLLKHETTVRLLESKWRYVPRVLYYSHLFMFFLFIAFYSINIELYKKDYCLLQGVSKYFSLGLIFYFIILELIQFLDSILSVNIFQYVFSYKNVILFFNFPLCIAVLFLEPGEVKSSLYSITILLSYCMLIQRLDKFYGIGPYVSVFGDVIRNSSKILIIIFIAIIGFLLSFRNRADYSTNPANEMTFFNGTFELTLFKTFLMFIGGVNTDGMGLDSISIENMVNFIIYGCFLFIVSILFINIFTGIAINAIAELIANSEANIILNKIEYVFKWDSIIKKTNHKWFYFILQQLLKIILGMKEFIIFFENIFVSNANEITSRSNYFKQAYENFKRNQIKNIKQNNKNQIEELDKKLNNVLFELKKMSVMNQNKFEYLENKMELNNSDTKIDDLLTELKKLTEKIKE